MLGLRLLASSGRCGRAMQSDCLVVRLCRNGRGSIKFLWLANGPMRSTELLWKVEDLNVVAAETRESTAERARATLLSEPVNMS